MGKIELVMPKMGESIMEATILKWLKTEGEKVEMDEPLLEIATDKVDSDIPSPATGILSKILHRENETIAIGKVIAYIETEQNAIVTPSPATNPPDEAISDRVEQNGNTPERQPVRPAPQIGNKPISVSKKTASPNIDLRPSTGSRFYSPLVRTIAQQEDISLKELDKIQGTGSNGRVTKNDILSYVSARNTTGESGSPEVIPVRQDADEVKQTSVGRYETTDVSQETKPAAGPPLQEHTEIIEMDRMRKLIADHMVMSKRTSPHVTSFVEVDVTNIVNWREKVKSSFEQTYGEKITYTPIFMEAVVRALKDFPMVNCSLEGDQIIKKNFVNLGMAAALPSGNLIVPVIRNADHLNLLGLTKAVNDLATRARANKLSPDEIKGGTFTLTNVGTFGNVMGTPIINQPQVAILAVGAIRKKPAVIETEMGDLIAVRQMMFLSLSYDHRIVDGFLGGSFLRRIADYLEAFDKERNI